MSNKPTSPQDLADQYIAELMDGGHAVDPGQFTMDREVAREKLSEFQLPDPAYYVLLLIRSATLQGARHLDVRTDARGLQLRFNGEVYGRRDLDELYDTAMSGRADSRSRSLRALALGLRTVSEVEGFLSLDVVSGDDHQATRLRLESGRGELIEQAPPGLRGTAIVIRFAERSEAEPPEVAVLDERCGYSDAEIYVNGRDVTHGLRLRLDEAVLAKTFDDGGVRGATGFAPAQEHAAELRLVYDGVLLATHALDAVDACFVAVVDASELELDLSQFDVIQDEAYSRMVQIAQRRYAAMPSPDEVQLKCERWRKKRASAQLSVLVDRMSAATFKVDLVAGVVLGLVLAFFVVAWFGMGPAQNPFIAIVAPTLVVLLIVVVVAYILRSRRRNRAFELASGQLLPANSEIRRIAVQQAKRRGGAITRLLR